MKTEEQVDRNYESVFSGMKNIPSMGSRFGTKMHLSNFDRHISVWFMFEWIKNSNSYHSQYSLKIHIL